LIENLDKLIDELGSLHSKLILLVGPKDSSKLLSLVAKQRNASPLNIGVELGARLAAMPQRQRGLQAPTILRELADQHAQGDLLLVSNIELLFDRSLQLNPLDLLKRHAHARRVLAIWPGEIRDGRLTYADMGHPEQQDYGLEGLVPFETN
jgi:hypothetical protein